MLKAAWKAAPVETFMLYDSCYRLNYFPKQWKVASIILLNKPGKDPKNVDAYRPISLYNCITKVYDKFITNRIYYHLHSHGIISNNQFGFNHGKSTSQAVKSIIDQIMKARDANMYISMICLDVKAAFDRIWIPSIMQNLKNANCPKNIYKIIAQYLFNRKGILTTTNNEITVEIELGVPQGSSLGPTRWNLSINPLLRLELPEGCTVQAFADDICLLVKAKSRRDLEERGNTSLDIINKWSTENKLDFSINKSSCMTFKKLKPPSRLPIFKLRGISIKHTSELLYLGITIDNCLTFIPHLNNVKDKATNILQGLNRISKATWGLKGEVLHQLYNTCIERIILYGVGGWWRNNATSKTTLKLRSIQRLAALAITKAFKTTSTEALLVLAGLIPVDYKAIEEVKCFLANHYSQHLGDDRTIDLNNLNKPVDQWWHHPANIIQMNVTTKVPLMRGNEMYTDGSKSDSNAGCAFTFYSEGKEIFYKKFRINTESSIFSIEAFAIKEALSWLKDNLHTETTIFTDSLSTISALEHNNSTNQIIENIKDIWSNMTNQPTLSWVKAHNNCPGNDRADELAKEASNDHTIEITNLGTSLSYFKTVLHNHSKIKWTQEWDSSSNGRHTYQLMPRVIRKQRITLNYYSTQLFTGHGNFPSYLLKHGHRGNSICHCGAQDADANHYIHHCESYYEERKWYIENHNVIINNNTNKIFTRIMKNSIIRNDIH